MAFSENKTDESICSGRKKVNLPGCSLRPLRKTKVVAGLKPNINDQLRRFLLFLICKTGEIRCLL
jgi:hypothetical protein